MTTKQLRASSAIIRCALVALVLSSGAVAVSPRTSDAAAVRSTYTVCYDLYGGWRCEDGLDPECPVS